MRNLKDCRRQADLSSWSDPEGGGAYNRAGIFCPGKEGGSEMEGTFGIHGKDIIMEDHVHVSSNTGETSYQIKFLDDPDTGMMIKKVIYKKGGMLQRHTHHCAHGLYILNGVLHTSIGDFEPGSFVWFKEGDTMVHGAKDGDVEALFITNKPFDIRYLDR